jgi:hypothetical protein
LITAGNGRNGGRTWILQGEIIRAAFKEVKPSSKQHARGFNSLPSGSERNFTLHGVANPSLKTNGDFEPLNLGQNEYASMGWSKVSGSK